MELTSLSSTELLTSLDMVWIAGTKALARMLAYLGEVERRGLHVEMACSSMFVFVERRFGLTGGSAFRRLTAARLVRRFPVLLAYVERGDLHLEALCALRDVLTSENVDEMAARVARKTLREVEHVVACLAPKPDVPPSIRKLPERAVVPAASKAPAAPAAPASAPVVPSGRPTPPVAAESFAREVPVSRGRLEQLSEERHKVQLTVGAETRAKIERARALMKHRNPSGDLEVIFDRAMDALLEKLEKERLAKTERPQSRPRPSQPGHVPAEVRREVFARDEERCTFVASDGTRCGSTELLELDHIVPRARGGSDDAENLRVACRAHNRRYAEEIFGREHVAAKIEERRAGTATAGGSGEGGEARRARAPA
ncbi:MAG: HNH endonuclease [Deltaproteobacteria bacterium]|nr:HNH endonuclease [Deltaproteobacteria bacterium]